MIACVIGQQKYTKNLYWEFRNCNRKPFPKVSVKCINTGEIFESVKDAANWCGLSTCGNISSVCTGRIKFAGKHPITKEQLMWAYANK